MNKQLAIRTIGIFSALALLLFLNVSRAEKIKPKTGQWETTITMEMSNMPMQIPPVTVSSCLTDKDLVPNTSQPGQQCKDIKQKIVGKNVEWSMKCKDDNGGAMEMKGKGTYKNDTFSGAMQMKITPAKGQSMKMNAKISSKYVGPCKEKSTEK